MPIVTCEYILCKNVFNVPPSALARGGGKFCKRDCYVSATKNQRLASTAERFWSRVHKTETCWFWTGGTFSNGYGLFTVQGKTIGAHRYVFQQQHGLIPKDMFICHTCDNPPCVNPAHLFLGTHTDNMQDCISKGRFSHHGQKGSLHNLAKLREKDIPVIRSMLLFCTPTEISKIYKVAPTTISYIRDRKTWTHVL